jgi:hypothetical protein
MDGIVQVALVYQVANKKIEEQVRSKQSFENDIEPAVRPAKARTVEQEQRPVAEQNPPGANKGQIKTIECLEEGKGMENFLKIFKEASLA